MCPEYKMLCSVSMVLSDPLVRAILSAFFAVLFANAAWHKLQDRPAFEQAFAAYKIVPQGLNPLAAIALPFIELSSVALLVYTPSRASGLLLVYCMLVIYGLAMTVNLLRGRQSIDCGCGAQSQQLSWALVFRNALLALLAFWAFWATWAAQRVILSQERSLDWLDYLSFGTASLALYGLYAIANVLLAQSRASQPVGVNSDSHAH
jgi:hypothetical protein